MHRHTSILTANHYPTLPDINPYPHGRRTADTDHLVADVSEQTTTIDTGIDTGTTMDRIISDLTHNPSVSPEVPPPIPSPCPHQIRVAEHTDVSMLTIVAASAPGLEIYEKHSDTYQPVAHVKGALIVKENQRLSQTFYPFSFSLIYSLNFLTCPSLPLAVVSWCYCVIRCLDCEHW